MAPCHSPTSQRNHLKPQPIRVGWDNFDKIRKRGQVKTPCTKYSIANAGLTVKVPGGSVFKYSAFSGVVVSVAQNVLLHFMK